MKRPLLTLLLQCLGRTESNMMSPSQKRAIWCNLCGIHCNAIIKKQGFSPLEQNSLRFIYDLHKLINLTRTPHHVTQNVIFFDAIQCNKGQILRSW